MSEVKAPKKSDTGSKKSETTKSETTKSEGTKTEAVKSATAAETPSADKSASKPDTAPKSASQSSISHFSSVSTPAYRSGWEAVFGGGKNAKKTSKTSNGVDLPQRLRISDGDIELELRNLLYKAFQRQARKQGVSLSKMKKIANIEYSLDCNITDK